MFDGVLGLPNLTNSTRLLIEQTVERLAQKATKRAAFRSDPLLGSNSLRHSLESSAVKRHGAIIELAIGDALRASSLYEVWHDVGFLVSERALEFVDGNNRVEDCIKMRIPYGTKPVRKIKVDLIAYNKQTRHLGAYEIKRGVYKHDSEKSPAIRKRVIGVHVSLASWAEQKLPWPVAEAEAKALFFYGARSIDKSLSLSEGFAQHFGCPIMSFVDAATEYMRSLIFDHQDALISLGANKKQLALDLGVPNA